MQAIVKAIVKAIDYNGIIELGHQVKIGYYAQNQSDLLDEDKTIIQIIDDAANEQSRPRVRDILGSFLFSGDSVQKKVKVLSGGERARVALCKLLLEPVNLLIMDEPTNHLDMVSKDILKNALKMFDGTLIIVSHDRDFLQGLSQKVYEFKNKNLKEYLGDINDFLNAKKVIDFKQFELKNNSKVNKQKIDSPQKLSYNEKKDLEKKIRKISNKVNKLEKEVYDLEEQLKTLDLQLADSTKFKELSSQEGFFENYKKKQVELNHIMTEWENSITDLDRLKSKRDEHR